MAKLVLFKGGIIVTASGARKADLLVDADRGKIISISANIKPKKSAEMVKCHRLHIFPGAIDPHVHFREPESTEKEDFESGSASALAGGVTSVIDMPCYRNPPTTTIRAYVEKKKIALGKFRCDYQLRFGASNSNQKEAARSGAPSLKVFLSETKSELSCSYSATAKHFAAFPKNLPICVHAEDRYRIRKRLRVFHEGQKAQDKISAYIACKKVLEYAKRYGNRRVHICHITTLKEAEMCQKQPNATYEINPAHLYLCTDDLKELGFMGIINPPLRDRAEMKRLWKAVGDGAIIASDHAPHLPSQKRAGAPGFPGVGTMLPLMLHAAHAKKLPLLRIAKICSYNAASAFCLEGKGEIAEGKDADLVLVDMEEKWEITAKNRLSRCGWTPYEGMQVYGKIESVYLRGKLAYDGERVLSSPGSGREIPVSAACK